MILRSLLLRHGRRALPKPPTPTPIRACRRYLASEVETTYTNPLQDQQFVESGIGGTKSQAIASLPTRDTASATTAADSDLVKQDWDFFQHQKKITNPIGTSLGPHYKPHELLAYPPWPKDITLELLMASQAHIGHATSLWNPANAKYIFGVRGERDPIHIISLDVTAAHLRRACKIVRGVTERGGLVLFVGSREGQARTVVKAAQMAQGCHLFSKWIPGSITNGQQILGKCSKKVVDEHDNVVEGFEGQLLQKAALKPDLVVCLNPLENYVLLHECGLNNIPTIGIIDTDANPTWVTYPIPANDDSLRSVQVIAGVLGRAGQEGQEVRAAKAKRGIVDYMQNHGLEPPSEEDEEAKQKLEKEQSLLAAADAFEVEDLDVEDEAAPDAAHAMVGEDGVAVIPGVDRSLVSEQDSDAHEYVFQSEERGAAVQEEGVQEQQAAPLFAGEGEGGQSAEGEGGAWREKGGQV
ncbi:hypothetical protein LTR36_007651 [Oleoguttula mirabilis]|uniref:Ribosomal protein S2 n=1 Tax=Oleoguttula mirabilis TaxID=1507867 RepID=A0AAV9JU12_9PEZI|nr:hypothetical protein LTR36_007651 [Oleoguttula mirabilis]